MKTHAERLKRQVEMVRSRVRAAANGFSNAAPVGANYYEVTAGVAIKPFPKDKILSCLLFRPEIRYDHSDRSNFSTGERDQLTFSMDGLLTF